MRPKSKAFAEKCRIELQPFPAGPLETMRKYSKHADFRVSVNPPSHFYKDVAE
jgi:hypothetical protein